jgi:cytochrome oxidase Cu insertion factor (SCO1/SenC/PrrC family)
MEAGARSLRPARLGIGRIAAVLIVAILAGIAAGAGVHLISAGPVPPAATLVGRGGLDGQATWAPGVRAAPAITTLVDQTGHRFSLSLLRGRTVAMVFFDSHCNQECPLEGRQLAAVERSLPASKRAVLVAVSVNPLDTAASVRHAARAWGLAQAANWHWLMGSRAQLASVWKAYHIYVGRPVNGDIPHTEAVYLIDRRGDERSGYLYPFMARFVAHDLTVLAREPRT